MYKFLIPIVALAVLLAGCSSPSSVTPPANDSTGNTTQQDNDDSKVQLLTGKHTVVLKTSKGDISIEVDADRAPKAATNFYEHAKEGYYDNLTFHRVISGFMIQGGDPTGTGAGGDSIFGGEFEDEITDDMTYSAGTVAMANHGPDTNGSQFFIMHKDYPLPPLYTIFGKVTAGQDVVNAIAGVKTGPGDRPLEPVTFKAEAK